MSAPIQLIHLLHSARRARRVRRLAVAAVVALAWLCAMAVCFAAPPLIAGALVGKGY